LKKKHKDNFTF